MNSILLKNVANLIRGVSYKTDDLHDKLDNDSIPLLKNNNVNNDGTISLKDVVYVDRSKVTETQILKKGDIIVCTSGSDSLVGKSAQFQLDGEYTFGAFCKVIRPHDINAKYLGCYFISPHYRKLMSSIASGAIMKNLRNEHLLDLKIKLFDNNIQEDISNKVSVIQKIIRLREEQLVKMDELIKSTFKDMFELNKSNWKKVSIADMCTDTRTGPFGSALHHDEFVDEGVFVLGIDNAVENEFSYNRMRYITKEKYNQLKRYTVYPGDVIITIMGTVGRSAVIPENMPLAINTKHLACLTPNYDVLDSYFLSKAFQIHTDIRKQLRSQTKGAIMDGLNLGIIKKLEFNLPPIELQKEFTDLCMQINLIKNNIINDKKIFEELQSSLMQEYFG